MRLVRRTIQRLRPHAARPWFPPAMSLSAALDYVFFAASPQLLLIVTVLLRGDRWRIVPWCFAVASALGAVAVALAIQLLGQAALAGIDGDAATLLPAWADRAIERWGVVALFALCALPLSMRSPVFVVALAGLPTAHIALAVLSGRLVAYHIVAAVTALTPRRLLRVPGLASVLDSLGIASLARGTGRAAG